MPWGAPKLECPFRAVPNSGKGARPLYLHVDQSLDTAVLCWDMIVGKALPYAEQFLERVSAAGGRVP